MAAPPLWDGMVSVDVALSRLRCGDAVDLINRTARARHTCDDGSQNSRGSLDPFRFMRAEVDIVFGGRICFGVREADNPVPSTDGVRSPDVLVVGTGGHGYARGDWLPSAPRQFELHDGETFTLRLDRAARVFYYIVKGVVSPRQYTDLADGPLEFVFFLYGKHTPPSQLTIVDVRVDAASAAAISGERSMPIEEV